MTFDWREFLDLALALAPGPTEAQKRAAISRAYYAAYNVTRKYLKIMATGEGSHQRVWDDASRATSDNVKLAGKKGQRLKQKRILADYTPNIYSLDYIVTESIQLAIQICDGVDPRPASAIVQASDVPVGPQTQVVPPEGNETK